MTEQDPMMAEMQIVMDALEAERDPDDNEIEAYARSYNFV